MSQAGLTREFLAERDARIFAQKKTGAAVSDIAKRFGMSSAAVNAAIARQLQRLNREARYGYAEVLRLELERLDALQASIWPLTQHRRVKTPDGQDVTVEPDPKFVQQVLAIMAQRQRLLQLDQQNINVVVETDAPARATLAGVDRPAEVTRFDPETEARQLIHLMAQANALPPEIAQSLLGHSIELPPSAPAPTPDPDILDAELVDDPNWSHP